MNITIKLLLLLYLLLMITVTIFGFAWTLTAIFAPKWATKKASIIRQEKTFNHMK